MINSRKIEDLLPPVQDMCRRFLDECDKGLLPMYDVLITSTYRDHASQNALYAIGRSKPGRKVTNARGGQSYHNWRVAFDIVPLRNGTPIWGTKGDGIDSDPSDDKTDDLEVWQMIGAIGKSCGLEWAGDWKKFREYPHFQATGGLSLADFKIGLKPKY